MKSAKRQNFNKEMRAKRARFNIFGTAVRPRLSVFRSSKFDYVQLIDDASGRTLVSGSTKGIDGGSKSERARVLGKTIAEKAKKEKLETVVFDKGPYKYHGRIKEVADGAREGGLRF